MRRGVTPSEEPTGEQGGAERNRMMKAMKMIDQRVGEGAPARSWAAGSRLVAALLMPVLTAALCLTLAGCRSSKAGHTGDEQTTPTQVVPPTAEGITAKLKLTLEGGGKSINCGGTLKLLRGRAVQVNLTYSVFIMTVNVGTLQLTPDSLMLIDRIGKRYCQATYSQLPMLSRAGLDFESLERYFWGLADPISTEAFSVSYGSYLTLQGGGQFPAELRLRVQTGGQGDYKATFAFSKAEETSDWDTSLAPPSDCRQVNAQTIIDALTSLAK